MERRELIAWLGPAATEITEEQVERLLAEADRIDARHADEMQRQAALFAAFEYLTGGITPEEAGHALNGARRSEREAMAASQQVAAMAVSDGVLSEVAAAQAAAIDRMTLRKVLGK